MEQYNLKDNKRTTEVNFRFSRDSDFDVFLVNQPKNSSIFALIGAKKKIVPQENYRLLENKGETFVESK